MTTRPSHVGRRAFHRSLCLTVDAASRYHVRGFYAGSSPTDSRTVRLSEDHTSVEGSWFDRTIPIERHADIKCYCFFFQRLNARS